MEFNYGSEPDGYMKYKSDSPVNDTSDLGAASSPNIERPIVSPGEIGQSVTEGSRFGTFLQTVTAAIRTGASKIEMQTGMGGGAELVGAESYGQEARQALREIAKANEIELTSVHVPTQVGNVSGFNPQQGFVDEQKKQALDEIKKAIDFAADVVHGGSIVFHTGEYQRPISEQDWAKRRDAEGNKVTDKDGNQQYDFLSYAEEPGKAVTYMVDDRNGKIIGDVRKSNVIREPEYKRAEQEYDGVDVDGNRVKIKKGDLITDDNEYIDLANTDHLFKRVAIWDSNLSRFKTRKLAWDEIEERKEDWNKKEKQKAMGNPYYVEQEITAEEMAYRIQIENQILQYRGSSLFHGRMYEEEKRERDAVKKALKFYEELEKNIPEEEAWKILRQDPNSRRYAGPDLTGYTTKKPSEVLKEALLQAEQSLQYTHEASSSADAQADTLKDTLEHVVPVGEFAKDQSFGSMAEAGIYAMQKTNENSLNKDIYLSPENIFPEMGYGSHPEEMIELVKGAREKMITYLTEEKIKDPHNRIKLIKSDNGEMKEEIAMVENPFRRPGFSKEKAKKLAERHIKANLDTQHLGMWAKHFQPIYLNDKGRMETPEEKNKRFDGWYKKQVERLSDEGILGEIHIVDGFHTGGHTHLPAGQGDLPVVDAVEYLKKKGFKGVMVSEGYGEDQMGPGRILTKTWEAFGAQVFPSGGYFTPTGGGFGAPVSFTDIHQSYFHKKQSPYFVFGGYSPSNDWTLWSEVPLE